MALENGFVIYNAQGDPIKARGSKAGALRTIKRIPDFADLVMAGKVWHVQDQTTTAVLVAPPVVTSGLTVQNPATSGKHYVVFSLSGYVDVVPATLGMVSAWHCAHRLGVALYTRDISLQATGAGAINGLKAGQGAYSGEIILDRGATVVDDGWTPTPLFIESNIATTNFVAKEAQLIVPVIIPPGMHYSIAGLATVVTFEAGWGLTWAELDRDELE